MGEFEQKLIPQLRWRNPYTGCITVFDPLKVDEFRTHRKTTGRLAPQGRQQPQGNMPCFATTACAWNRRKPLDVQRWTLGSKAIQTSYHHAKPHFYRLQVFLCGASKCIFCLFFLGGWATTHLCVFLLGFIGKKKPLLSMIFCRIMSGVCFWGGLSQPLTNPLPCDFRETPQGCLRCCMRIRVSTKMSCKIHSCNLFNWATSWKPGRILSIESHIAVY